MELSLAHEASQRTLKQRNLLALICIVLGILVVVMFTAASTRDREVVLQPILPNEMTLSSSSVTPEYLEAVIAVSISNRDLASGQATAAYVVVPTGR
jgi:conjugal transfer pilus assembly protein TraE